MLSAVLYMLYLWMRWFFMLMQDFCLGSSAKRAHQKAQQAHWMRIVGRKKLHPFLVASRNDFVGLHQGFRSPQCVLQPDISLYSVDATTATFVQMPPMVPLYSPGNSPHLYVTQFRKAIRVIEMPLEMFCKVAGSIPTPSTPVVLLSDTAQCGCGILMDSMHSTGQIQTLWEPDALTNLVHGPVSEMEPALMKNVIDATMRYLCRQRDPRIKGQLIKTRSHVSKLIPTIHEASPWVGHLFAYSKPLDQICAAMAAFEKTPLRSLWKTTKGRRMLFETNPALGKVLDKQVNSFFTSVTWMWAQTVSAYLNAWNNDVPIAAISYESLLCDPQKAFDNVWQYCGFGEEKLAPWLVENMKSKLAWLETRREQAREKFSLEYSGRGEEDADAISNMLGVQGLRLDSRGPLVGTLVP